MFDPFLTLKQILRKLGGDFNVKKVSILDVSLAEDAETPGFTVYRDLSDASPFELGKTYTVHLDSGSYKCVAKAMDGIGNVLGNTVFGGGADTGETFLVAIMGGIAMVMDANCGTKASVTTNVETIVPIDQKYLTKVVDLTKYDAGGNSLNDVVLGLFSSGGGKTSVSKTAGTDAFWHDVSDGCSIRFLIDAMSVKILADANSTTLNPDDGTAVAIEASFLISLDSVSRVTVLFGYGATMDVVVAVEPVTVPGA